MESNARQRAVEIVIVATAVSVSWWGRAVNDDAFISLRYARHFAHGAGLTWNPGFEAVEGYTNLSWVLLAAAAIWVGIPPEPFVVGLGLVSLVALLVLARALGRVLLGEGWGSTAVLALTAANATVLTHAASGLETIGAAALATATLLSGWHLHERGWSRGRFAAFAAVGGLALLTRLDTALAVACGGVLASVVRVDGGLRFDPRKLLAAASPFVVLLAAWTAWRMHYYGDLLPNTARVKSASLSKVGPGLGYLGAFVTIYLPIVPLAVILATGALSRGLRRARREWTGRDALVVASTVYVIVHVAYVVAVGGGYLGFRLLANAVVPLIALLALGCAASVTRPALRFAAVALFLAISLRPFVVMPDADFHWRQRVAPLVDTMRDAGLALGAAFATFPFEERPVVAVVTAGALPYYSDLPAYDLLGLNTPDLADVATYRPEQPAGHRMWVEADRLVDQRVNFFVPAVWKRPRSARMGEYVWDETPLARYPRSAALGALNPSMLHVPLDDETDMVLLYVNPTGRFDVAIEAAGWTLAPVRFSP